MSPLLPFEWIAALRFMRDGLTQTLLVVVGVALGVAVITFMSALLTGLQSNLFRRTLNFQAQIVVTAPEEVARAVRDTGSAGSAALAQARAQRLRSVDQWQKVKSSIEAMPGVVAIAPVVSGPALAIRADATNAVSVIGMDPASYLRVIALADKIVAGSPDVGASGAIVGIDLAHDLGATLGDRVRLSTAAGNAQLLEVAGVFDFGNKGVNQRNVYIPLHIARSLLDLPGGVSSLEVNVDDPFAAERVAQAIHDQTGMRADSWIRTNAQFFQAIAAQTLSNTFIRFFVALTAALGIASVLVVSVVQKAREIGILRAMGTSRGQVVRIFLIEGALMGLVGSVIGSLLGSLFLDFWRGVARNPDGTPMFVVDFEPMLFVYAAVGATLLGMLAAIVPARRAASLDPAIAIRG
ncbi:MAG: FtsX-like permease family protein [Burkholderiales bacterium]